MTHKKGTKHALLMSVISLLLCCSMLIGTTFAWFTDEVSTLNNKIVAGNLDVELYWSTNATDWEEVDDQTNVFKNEYWEPGHTEVVYLKIVNKGTLALQYNLRVNIADETEGTNVYGDKFLLSDYIMFDVIPVDGAYADRDAARKDAAAGATKLNVPYANPDVLLDTNEDDIVAMVVYMPESVDNVANHLTGTKAPEINLGINLYATQYTKENDSFGPDYDEDAVYPDNMWVGGVSYDWYTEAEGDTYYISTPADLAGFANIVNGNAPANMARGGETLPADSFKGKTVKLTANMDLADIPWTSIGTRQTPFNGTFDGDGHTIANLNVTGETSVGFFGWIGSVSTVKNVVFDSAYVSGTHYVGVIIGWEGNENANATIENCVVMNSTVICDTDASGDNGDKVGAIVGYAVSLNITNCTVKDTTIKGYRDIGGILGYANGKVLVSGNTVENINLVIDNEVNYKDYTTDAQHDANLFVGEAISSAKVSDNNVGEGNLILSYVDDAETMKNALAEGKNVYVAAGKYSFPASSFTADSTMVCAEGVVFEGKTALNINGATVIGATFTNNNDYLVYSATINGTFKDCVFTNSDGLRYCYAGETVVFENCVFDTDFYGVHFDGGANDVVFKNCTFSGFNTFGAKVTKLTFEGCTFKYNGKGGYNGANLYGNTELIDCVFVFDGTAGTEWVHARGTNKTYSITNCVVTDGTNEKPLASVFVDNGTDNTITVDGAALKSASSQEELKNAITSSDNVSVNMGAGNYVMPEPDLRGNTVIISGTKDTVIDMTKVDARDQFVTGATLVFDGVTLNFGTSNYMGLANTASLTFKNCEINGLQFLYGANVTFENCKLNSNGAEHCVWTYGAQNVTFNNCEFTYGDRGINCYSDNDVTGGKQTVNFNNCTFVSTNTASKGAVEINSCFFSVGIEVNMDGCTAPAYGKMAYVSEWDSTNGAKTTINIK